MGSTEHSYAVVIRTTQQQCSSAKMGTHVGMFARIYVRPAWLFRMVGAQCPLVCCGVGLEMKRTRDDDKYIARTRKRSAKEAFSGARRRRQSKCGTYSTLFPTLIFPY